MAIKLISILVLLFSGLSFSCPAFGGYVYPGQGYPSPGTYQGQIGQSPYLFGNPYNPWRPGVYPQRFYQPSWNAPYYPNFPAVGVPQPMAGGYFRFGAGTNQFNYWRAPSGYFYPWYQTPLGYVQTYGFAPPVIIYQQGAAAKPAQPPLATMFKDMANFLDDSKDKGRLSSSDYNDLHLRLKDLSGKAEEEQFDSDGQLDSGQEADLRNELNELGEDVSRRLKS